MLAAVATVLASVYLTRGIGKSEKLVALSTYHQLQERRATAVFSFHHQLQNQNN